MNKPQLSIVIPTLNEAESLPGLLADLRNQEQVELEIIAGDGGSHDNTRTIVRQAGGIVIDCPRGRGAQMNRAAARATAECLLFLHADSRLLDSKLLKKSLETLQRAIDREGHGRVAGHYRLQFLRVHRRNSMSYRYMEGKTAFNRPNTTSGDQGFFLKAAFFRELGGFETDWPFLEDQTLAEKIRVQGRWITLPGRLATSARRFEKEGFHRRYILMSMIMGLYSAGCGDFFRRARTVYQSQAETGPLLLTPFFRTGWEVMRRDLGFWPSIALWYRIGRFVRQNSWQLFYFLDILTHQDEVGHYPFVRFHDRYFGPLTDFRICDVITAFTCWAWFLMVLGPYFRIVEARTHRGRLGPAGMA